MNAYLSIKNLSLLLFLAMFTAIPLKAVEVHKFRLAGEPLDISLQQEADYAAANALKWLRARQNPDGSWGSSTANVERTAIVLLALVGHRDRSNAHTTAALWLDANPPTTNDTQAAAWRLIALLSSAASSSSDDLDTLAKRLLHESPIPKPAITNTITHQLISTTALSLINPHTTPPTKVKAITDHLATLAGSPTLLRSASPSDLWLAARTINLAGRSVLISNEEKVDWRRDIAQNLVNSQQRSSDSDGAFWEAPTSDDSITTTALALLALREL